MISSTPSGNQMQTLVQNIKQTGQLSRQDHLMLSSILLSAFELSAVERSQINRIFDDIRSGQITLMD
ncbi:MAG: hypothetical protein AAF152_06800 [Cyanobacteria bacterium P01_A01_bin.114]